MKPDISTRIPPAILTPEDRCSPRTRIAIPATLRLAGGRSTPTILRDISIAGFCATAINRIPVNALCWLSVPGLESLQAQVVWWADGEVGGAFAQLLNPIVLEHLVTRWQRSRSDGKF